MRESVSSLLGLLIESGLGTIEVAMGLELFKHDVELPEHVGLALVITGDPSEEGQRHTGFVVRTLDGSLVLFHLAANNCYVQNVMSARYRYLLVPILEPEVEMPIVAFLYYLYGKTQGRIAYSIAWDSDEYFNDSGELVKISSGDGFTCATFVLETLKRHGLDLVDRSTWPITESDAGWQRGILNVAGLSADQFLAQVEAVGKYPRFRPEQALGAAHYYDGQKLPYGVVQPAGVEVVAEMIRLSA